MSFPVELFRPEDDVLSLFCAAFGGRQDVRYLMDAGVRRVMCVDNDAVKLEALLQDSPKGWRVKCGDGFEFIDDANDWGVVYDAVTLDPWTGDMSRRVREKLPTLVKIANRLLVVGMDHAGAEETMATLRGLGWEPVRRERSRLAVWIVATKKGEAA